MANTLELQRPRVTDQAKPQQSPDAAIFSRLVGLSGGRKKGEGIITRPENTRVLFAPLASADVKTTAFSASNIRTETEGDADKTNGGGLEGTGGRKKPV